MPSRASAILIALTICSPPWAGTVAARLPTDILTSQWQCAEMGFPNHYRRTLVLYELPRTDPSLPEAYVRSIFDLLAIPHYDALSVLDRDEDWRIYYGSYPNFYPRIAATIVKRILPSCTNDR